VVESPPQAAVETYRANGARTAAGCGGVSSQRGDGAVELVPLGAEEPTNAFRVHTEPASEVGPHRLVDAEQAARIQVVLGADVDVAGSDAERLQLEPAGRRRLGTRRPSAYSTGLAATSSPRELRSRR
jgi:hypothetical protein